jgi:exonuclease III
MAQPLQIQYPGTVYPIIRRGNKKKPVAQPDLEQIFMGRVFKDMGKRNEKMKSYFNRQNPTGKGRNGNQIDLTLASNNLARQLNKNPINTSKYIKGYRMLG